MLQSAGSHDIYQLLKGNAVYHFLMNYILYCSFPEQINTVKDILEEQVLLIFFFISLIIFSWILPHRLWSVSVVQNQSSVLEDMVLSTDDA